MNMSPQTYILHHGEIAFRDASRESLEEYARKMLDMLEKKQTPLRGIHIGSCLHRMARVVNALGNVSSHQCADELCSVSILSSSYGSAFEFSPNVWRHESFCLCNMIIIHEVSLGK